MKKRLIKKIIFSTVICLVFSSTSLAAGTLDLYSGNGNSAYIDSARLDSSFFEPFGMTLDKDGGLIVVDSGNNLIRKIKDDKVTTIAGKYSVDESIGLPRIGFADGNALEAKFNAPRYAVVNSKGEIFVTDTGNNAVRKIAGGKVYTFSGNGTAGYADGSAAAARFNTPSGIAVDKDDNLFIADTMNNVIRKITPNGTVTTFAGNTAGGYKDGKLTEALFNEPSDLAFDKSGNLFIVDSGNQVIRKLDTAGNVTTIAGTWKQPEEGAKYSEGGFADGKKALFNAPKGIDIAEDGTIFISDSLNHKIRALKPSGTVITIVGSDEFGTTVGDLSKAQLNCPKDVLYSKGKLFISDTWNNSIKVIDTDTKRLIGIKSMDEMTSGIKFEINTSSVQVFVNKKGLKFTNVKPVGKSGSIYIPLRLACEALGAKVEWNKDSKKAIVTKDGFVTEFDSTSSSIIGINGSLLIKIRDLSTSLGLYIVWDSEHKSVLIAGE